MATSCSLALLRGDGGPSPTETRAARIICSVLFLALSRERWLLKRCFGNMRPFRSGGLRDPHRLLGPETPRRLRVTGD